MCPLAQSSRQISENIVETTFDLKKKNSLKYWLEMNSLCVGLLGDYCDSGYIIKLPCVVSCELDGRLDILGP